MHVQPLFKTVRQFFPKLKSLTLGSNNRAFFLYLVNCFENLSPNSSRDATMHSNTIHNSQRMYTIQCPSIDEWIKKRCYIHTTEYRRDFPGGSDGKASIYNAGDLGSIPGSGRSPGEGNGNPLQHSCLENPMDRGV